MKKLVEVLRDHDAYVAGSRRIIPAADADALAGRGIVRIVRDMTEAVPEPPPAAGEALDAAPRVDPLALPPPERDDTILPARRR